MRMNSDQINEQAQAILFGLNGYGERDIVRILSAATSLIVSQPAAREDGLTRSAEGYLFRLCTGQKGKIDRDPEINAFLHEIDHYLTLSELHALLVGKFGKVRAPSRSSLGRHFKKLEEKKGQNRKQLPKRLRK
jgi:hypothetical protein